MKQLQKIYTVSDPQNRYQGDGNAFRAMELKGRDPVTIKEHQACETGVYNNIVYYYRCGFGSEILQEYVGLLGLTAKNDNTVLPVTAEAVISYVNHYVYSKLRKIANKLENDHEYLVKNHEIVFNYFCDKKNQLIAYRINYLSVNFVEYLIEKGADIEAPLVKLCDEKETNIKLIQYFIQKGENVNFTNDCMQWTPLHMACLKKEPNLHIITLLLLNRAYPNLPDLRKTTPLIALPERCANYLPNLKVTQLLMAYGANHKIMDDSGNSLLHYAVDGYRFDELPPIELINFLIKQKLDVNLKNKRGFTVLDNALFSPNYDVIKILLLNGADPNISHIKLEDSFPLHRICTEDIELLTLLLEHGADPNAKNVKGYTALHKIVRSNYFQDGEIKFSNNFKILIDYKADINRQDDEGNTVLHLAMRNFNEPVQEYKSKLKLVELLVENGVNLNIQNNAGQTALHKALRSIYRDNAVIKFLLEKGAHTHIQDNEYGLTALHYACDYAHVSLEPIQLLLHYHADPNIKDHKGNTCLHEKCYNKYSELSVIKFLIENHVGLEVLNNKGKTALHYCVKHSLKTNSALLLIAYGAACQNITIPKKCIGSRVALCVKAIQLFGSVEILINKLEKNQYQEKNAFTLFRPYNKKTPNQIYQILLTVTTEEIEDLIMKQNYSNLLN